MRWNSTRRHWPADVRLARSLALDGEGVDAVIAWVNRLRREIGIPDTLAEIGD